MDLVTKTGAQPADELLGHGGGACVSEADYLPVFKQTIGKLEKSVTKVEKSAARTITKARKNELKQRFSLIMKSVGCPEKSDEYKAQKKWFKEDPERWLSEWANSVTLADRQSFAARLNKGIAESADPALRGLADGQSDATMIAKAFDRRAFGTDEELPAPKVVNKSADPRKYDNPVLQRLYDQARHEGSQHDDSGANDWGLLSSANSGSLYTPTRI